MTRRIFLLLALAALHPLRAQNQAQLGGGSLGGDTKVAVLTAAGAERPFLRDPGLLLEADEIRFEFATETATAIGHVEFTRGASRLLADRLVYHRRAGTFTAENIRLGRPPYFAEAFSAEGSRSEVTLRRARVSYGEPGPWQPTWNADTIVYSADGKIRSENSQIGIGHAQPLPFPKFQQDLGQPFAAAASFTGGYRHSLGAFADAVVLVPVTPGVRLGADVGVFTSRGFMAGPAGRYMNDDAGQHLRGSFRSGYINDHGDKGVDILGRAVPENRGYVEWQHEQTLNDRLELKAQVNWWKDSEVLRDFRPRAFFPVQVPDTFAEATYAAPNFIVSAFVRAQPNTFHSAQERLPEVRLDLLPTALGQGFYQRFNASVVRLRENPPPRQVTVTVPRSPIAFLPPPFPLPPGIVVPANAFVTMPSVDPTLPGNNLVVSIPSVSTVTTTVTLDEPRVQTTRLDAHYGLERPFAPTNWFVFTPLAGGRATYYTATPQRFTVGSTSLTGAPDVRLFPGYYDGGNYTRVLGELGFDAALRSSGTFAYKNEQWKIDGLRHLFTPRVSYRYIPDGDKGRGRITPIDREVFSTYLPPLGLGDQRNIDDLHATNTLRLGFDNILQTRDAATGTRDLLALNVANDFRFKRAPGERDVSEIHAELSFTPVRWLQFELYQSFAPQNFTLRELNSALTLRSGNAWSLRFSNNYLRHQIEDYLVDARVRINESYEAVTRLNYDTRRSRFNEQAYGIAHNLGNTWLISYTVSLYSGRRRESSFGFNVQIDTVRF